MFFSSLPLCFVRRGRWFAICSFMVAQRQLFGLYTDLICKEFNVSREWLLNGTGEMFLPESSGTVDALAAQYDLTPLERDMVENYCKLSKAQRQAFWDVMQKIIGSSAQSGSAEASPPGSGVAAAEAAYEKNFGTASGTPDAEATSMHEDTG